MEGIGLEIRFSQESVMPRLLRRLVILLALATIALATGCSHTAPQAALSANG